MMSYSGAESSMEDGGNHHRQTLAGNRRRRSNNNNNNNNGEEYFSGGDPAEWNAFAESFSKVQSVLDRNRMLIQQANENHQSRVPDNMVKNVAIIQELNGNISKVASIYSDLSVNFTGVVGQHRQQGGNSKSGGSNGRSS
uniref:Early flowering 4 n=1 Tax=Mesembryanthemum crystallinum TaxID=3544 RepID=Q6UEI6_MESCR|nr:early flowering 4 [Mesembryanthemum crystallinum]